MNDISPARQRAGKYAKFYLILIVLVVAFGVGYYYGRGGKDTFTVDTLAASAVTNTTQVVNVDRKAANNKVTTVDFDQFWQVWDHVKAKYYKQPIADSDMFYGAMQGMVASLGDPYSMYMPPVEAKEFMDSVEGEFSGIGAEIGVKNDQLQVISPLPGTPAEKAGLRPADLILAIDGEDTYGMNSNVAVYKIRGVEGTAVKLLIAHPEATSTVEISIVRAKINIPAIIYEVKANNVAYVRVMQFNNDTMRQFDKAVKDINSKKITKMVLDLRGNPGGYLDMAVAMASEWIPTGKVIVTEKYQAGRNNVHYADGATRLSGIKTIVLINAGSASASEIVAGALMDHQLAAAVGEKSYGKGSVQELESLPDGSALKLTIAEWYTPLDKNINKEGIKPDVEVKEDWAKEKVGEDAPLTKALELLGQ